MLEGDINKGIEIKQLQKTKRKIGKNKENQRETLL